MKIIELEHPGAGVRGALALDAPDLGPAFGGIRVASYRSAESCRADAKRLAAAMTRKVLIHDIPGSGGKAAIMADAIRDRHAAMTYIGEVVESLKGSFFTGPDTGFTADDTRSLTRVTKFVTTEDVTDATARGVLQAIRAACDHAGVDITRARVNVQGVGAVGLDLTRRLMASGARVTVADVVASRVAEARSTGADVAGTDDILTEPCDVLCPCALGGIIDATVVAALQCRIIAGAANNILAEEPLADGLADRDIVFVPDFVCNGGGVIRGAWVHLRGTPGTDEEIDAIYKRTRNLLSGAEAGGVTPLAHTLEVIERKRAR